MCGRYKQTSPLGSLAEIFGLTNIPGFAPEGIVQDGIVAAGIVAPGMTAPVIRDSGATLMTWGFVPAWSTEGLKTKIINARIETLAEKPSFRKATPCLVPADGFFEWDKSQKPARPYDFHLPQGGPFAFAGLCDTWINPATGEVRQTFAIVTREAGLSVAKIHERMPVILATKNDMAAWRNMEIKNLRAFSESRESILLEATPAHFPASAKAGGKSNENGQLSLF